MSKVLIRYILIKNENGFIEETKFIKDLDLENLPKPGDKIINFYGKEQEFFNLFYHDIDNKINFIKDGKLINHSPEQSMDTIKSLLTDYISILESSQSRNLIEKNDNKSVLENLKEQLSTFGIEKYNKVEFSEEKYKDIYNDLVLYSLIGPYSIASTLRELGRGINTLLAFDKKITHNGSDHFCYVYDDDATEDSEKMLSLSEAISCVSKINSINKKPHKFRM